MASLESCESAPRHSDNALPLMPEVEFARWAALLEERTGMSMPLARKSFLVTNLVLRMRELGFEDLVSYYAFLTSPGVPAKVEWTALVDRLTVHETRFFRDPAALALLADRLLPELVARSDWDGVINAWSVGCSSGEEVYSLAMVLHDFGGACALQHAPDAGAGTQNGFSFGVTGTDISLQSMATARGGTYPERRCAQIPGAFRQAYCETTAPGQLRVTRELRKRVAFAQMNVLDIHQATPRHMDLIYCQNLLIYFSRERRQAIIESLVPHLRPGGVLILGSGEMLNWDHPSMERIVNARGVLAHRRRI